MCSDIMHKPKKTMTTSKRNKKGEEEEDDDDDDDDSDEHVAAAAAAARKRPAAEGPVRKKKKERTAHEFSQPVWWCRALRSHVDPLRRRLVLTTLGAIISGFGLVCCVQCTRVCVCARRQRERQVKLDK